MNRQVYFAKCGDHIKIGVATNVRARLSSLQVGAAAPVELIAAVAGDQHLESALHKKLHPHRVAGEWFRDCDEVRTTIQNAVNNFDVGFDRKQIKGASVVGPVCKVLWPFKTAAHVATIINSTERHASRIIAGEFEAPGLLVAAIVVEITKRE